MTCTEHETQIGNGKRRATPWRLAAWSAASLVLIFPFVAMQLTDEVNWSVSDFAVAGALVLGVGIPLELAARRTADPAYRWAVAVALATAALLIVVNGAVGIIGSENDDVNLVFGGVLAVALVGSVTARFRSRGMVRAMAAAALAQAAVAVGALAAGLTSPTTDRIEIVALWGLVALWAGSAALFQKSASRRG